MRLDHALVARGLVASRSRAQELIRAGQVRVGARVVDKPSHQVADEPLTVQDDGYVSRAAHKLIGALDDSGTPVAGRVLDAGASTGGFTQVLLERGAGHVYAVDVGHDQLAEPVRSDPRVTNLERTNLRDLDLAHVDGNPVDLVVADVSFISLRLLLAPLLAVVAPGGTLLLMVEPQVEVGRAVLGKGGVVRDEGQRLGAVAEVVAAAAQRGCPCDWQGQGRVPGPAGNVEYFIRLSAPSHRLAP